MISRTVRILLSCFLLASIVLAPMVPVHAFTTAMPASLVIGQADFTHAGYSTSQAGLWSPDGLGFDASGNLWIADTSNSRVLMFAGSSGLTGFLLQLQAGWNLVSLPVVPLQSSPAQLLKALIQLNELVSVYGYTAGPKTGWSSFLPPNTGTLTSMVDGHGYWIYVREPVNITITGYVIPPGSMPPSYSLYAGWNLVGFKPRPIVQNETVGQYLTTIADSYDPSNILIYDNVNQRWIVADSGTWLMPGQAMWIKMTSAHTLVPQ